MDEANDPAWAEYPNTILRFHGDGGIVEIDLRVTIRPDQIARLLSLGLGPQFHILTAHNPRGRVASRAQNMRANQLLETELRTQGQAFIPCDGCSPSGEHIEAGVAAVICVQQARAHALAFEQSALFEFDGSVFWLQPALVKGAPRRLPVPSRTPSGK